MKIYGWTDTNAPPLSITPAGVIEFFDKASMSDFEVGDRIHYKTRLGVSVYQVVNVEKANEPNFDDGLRKVTAQRTE